MKTTHLKMLRNNAVYNECVLCRSIMCFLDCLKVFAATENGSFHFAAFCMASVTTEVMYSNCVNWLKSYTMKAAS